MLVIVVHLCSKTTFCNPNKSVINENMRCEFAEYFGGEVIEEI